jgi:hypothetical protein
LGWHKFSGELRKVSDFLSAKVGCGRLSPEALFQGGKEERKKSSSPFVNLGLSFAAVVSSGSSLAAKATTSVGRGLLRLRIPVDEPGAIELLPVVRSGDFVASRLAVDYSLLESTPVGPLVTGLLPCRSGNQQPIVCPFAQGVAGSVCFKWRKILNLNLNRRTWRKIFVSFKLAMGRVFGKHLGSLVVFGLGLRPKGLRLG